MLYNTAGCHSCFSVLQACVTSAEIKLGSALTSQAKQALLGSDALAPVLAHVTLNSTLLLKGCEQLVNQVCLLYCDQPTA